MSKVLVTGSSGLVGSATAELFAEKGYDVIGVDNNQRAAFFNTPNKVTENDIDITNYQAMWKIFMDNKFDVIVHAAAQPSHDYATDNVMEDFYINALGTVVLLELAREFCPDVTFIYVSTDKVYGS